MDHSELLDKPSEDEGVEAIPVGLGVRLANLFIDRIALYIIGYGTGMTIALRSESFDVLDNFAALLLLELAINFSYYFLLESFTQRTLGKFLTRTKVVMEDGSKPTAGKIAVRTLCRFIPFEPFSFLFGSGWHDRLTGTVVVKS